MSTEYGTLRHRHMRQLV